MGAPLDSASVDYPTNPVAGEVTGVIVRRVEHAHPTVGITAR
jgi:hypothetical protein